MENKRNGNATRTLVECGVMIALGVVLDLLCKFIPSGWISGGSISIGIVPIVYVAYRHGTRYGLPTAFAYALIQMLLGFHPPIVSSFWFYLFDILLDYVVAYTVVGLAPVFASFFKNRRILGYAFGTFAVCLLRFVSHTLSGVLVWSSVLEDGGSLGSALADGSGWIVSIVYNGGYMGVSTVACVAVIVALTLAVDPLTLKKYEK